MTDTFGRYEPVPLPTDSVKNLSQAVETELRRIAQSIRAQSVQYIYLEEQNAAPDRVMEGMVARADGTNWDPGSGRGVYCYQNSAWTLLG